MFIRRKKNRSGSTSIVVIDKSNGKFREIKTIGTSSDTSEIEKLYQQGKKCLSAYRGERDLFAEYTQEQKEKQVTEVLLLSNIENILLNGTQLILDKVFELVGFDKITDTVLKLILQMNCEKQDFQKTANTPNHR